MSTGDATVWIMCDRCQADETADLPFVYGGPMHTVGYYDHKNPRLPMGWVKIGDDEHLCDECARSDEAAS